MFKILLLLICGAITTINVNGGELKIYSAPDVKEVPINNQWQVTVNGQRVPVYRADVHRGGPASFCIFDFTGKAKLVVKSNIEAAKPIIRPLSAGITPSITKDQVMSFTLNKPGNYCLEPRHYTPNQPLFIFAGSPETNIPEVSSKSVRYFAPGYHEVGALDLSDCDTVYIAGGAYLKVIIPKGEKPEVMSDSKGMKRYKSFIKAMKRKKFTVRGRGILDFSALPWHARQPIVICQSKNILIEGITILDSPSWNITIGRSDNISINNVKVIGHRENSDGINICSSKNATVRNCFIRTGDDGLCVKTYKYPAENILVEKCVFWNDRVRGFGVIGESNSAFKNIVFRDIDIIHDLTSSFTQGWSMAVYLLDCGPASNILFENIRCEDTRKKLIEVGFSPGKESDTIISNITFRNIRYLGKNRPEIKLFGRNKSNRLVGVLFEDCYIGDTKIVNTESGNITVGPYVDKVKFK